MKPFLRMTALASATAMVLAACSNDTDSDNDENTDADALNVTASFYPLEYIAKEIGGDKVNVTSLTPPGSDAHNLELAPRDVTQLSDADLVLYLSGFQAAMDDAVATASPEHALDVNEYANLEGEHSHDHGDHDHGDEEGHDHDHGDEEGHDHDHDHGEEATDEAATDEHDHAEEDGHDHAEEDGHDHSEDDGHGHDHSGPDPHFWLDPNRMAALADPVAEELAAIDPDNADYYRENAADFASSMTELDSEYSDGLAQCETNTFVVTHEAFGYIARAYGLDQQAIAGLETDTEPSPARVAEVTDMIEELGVTTIFATSQAESSIADTFAAEANVEVGFLDALATQVDADNDYEDVMESNLDELKNALNCQ